MLRSMCVDVNVCVPQACTLLLLEKKREVTKREKSKKNKKREKLAPNK